MKITKTNKEFALAILDKAANFLASHPTFRGDVLRADGHGRSRVARAVDLAAGAFIDTNGLSARRGDLLSAVRFAVKVGDSHHTANGAKPVLDRARVEIRTALAPVVGGWKKPVLTEFVRKPVTD